MIEREKLISMVQNLKDGKEDAATVIYETFHRSVYYHILKLVNNDSELAADLTQDTFIYVLEKIHTLEEPAAFVVWINKIASSKCKDYSVKRKELLVDEYEDGYTIFDQVEEVREEFIPGEALDKEDLKRIILNIINELPTEQREAIILRYFNEISVKEIADIQGVSEGTVKSRLNYGRKSLKDAVETYEKKNDIKLHCAGVIPMLLWFFRAYRVSNGISLTNTSTSVFAITASAAEVTAATTATAAATAASSTAVETGVTVGAKVAGKTVAAKAIAAATAATVAVGGVAYSIFSKPDIDTWQGYGDVYFQTEKDRRFEVTVDDMNNSYISGHLEVSYLYAVEHDTEFEGQGRIENGRIFYEIVFETPRQGENINAEFTKASLEYDKETQILYLDGVDELDGLYEAELYPVDGKGEKILYQNETWSGQGNDTFHNSQTGDIHRFELIVTEMRQSSIEGKLKVFYNGTVEHESGYTGRGFTEDGIIHYEIKLDNPRVEKNLISLTLDNFWLYYSQENNTFEIPWPTLYQAVLYPSDYQYEETVATETTLPATAPETTEATEEVTVNTPTYRNSTVEESSNSTDFSENVETESSDDEFVLIITPMGDPIEEGGNLPCPDDNPPSNSADTSTENSSSENTDASDGTSGADTGSGDTSSESSNGSDNASSGDNSNVSTNTDSTGDTGASSTGNENTSSESSGGGDSGSSSSEDSGFVLIITPMGDAVEEGGNLDCPEG